MNIVRAIGADKLRFLVWTEGGAPNAAQRQRLARAIAGAKPQIALLTDSALAWTAGTAIQWFNPGFRIFPTSALEPALDHIGLAGTARTAVKQTLDGMRSRP